MVLVRILLAHLHSKSDSYGANLNLVLIDTLTYPVQKGPQDFLMLRITFKRLYFTPKSPQSAEEEISR